MKTYKKNNAIRRGFTLIELLVVIAIIGILSSVVLASLNIARAKGSDAAIEANLSGIRSQAEIMYSDHNCYGIADTCNASDIPVSNCPAALAADDSIFANEKVFAAIEGSVKNSDGQPESAKCSESINGEAWAISVKLKTDPSKYWCVDSSGRSKQIDGPHDIDTATTYQCP